MRRLLLLLIACVGAGLAGGCDTNGSPGTSSGVQGIHPQPQPNSEVKLTAPCTATACGTAPSTLASPHCKPGAAGACGWSENQSVSYRECAADRCGRAPGAEVCPPGTTFRGSTCGSENEELCAWSTACVPPPSTTPCPDGAGGCGPKPELGVICSDGGVGDLVCMQMNARCGWQRSCD